MKIVLASNNKGKLREIQAILDELEHKVIPQSQFDIADAEETGLTFVENSIIKARHASAHCQLPAIADDSGIEIEALNGAPGIYSARYAGPDASDRDNLDKLLNALKDVPAQKRKARFQCVIVYMRHANDPTPVICHGRWEGTILLTAQGENGFGYDPVFWVPTHQCSSAELSPEVKNAISHRGQALLQLKEFFLYTGGETFTVG